MHFPDLEDYIILSIKKKPQLKVKSISNARSTFFFPLLVDMHQKQATQESKDQNKDSQQPKHSLAQKHLHFPEVSKGFVGKHFLISFGRDMDQEAKIHRTKVGKKTNYNSQ